MAKCWSFVRPNVTNSVRVKTRTRVKEEIGETWHEFRELICRATSSSRRHSLIFMALARPRQSRFARRSVLIRQRACAICPKTTPRVCAMPLKRITASKAICAAKSMAHQASGRDRLLSRSAPSSRFAGARTAHQDQRAHSQRPAQNCGRQAQEIMRFKRSASTCSAIGRCQYLRS